MKITKIVQHEEPNTFSDLREVNKEHLSRCCVDYVPSAEIGPAF